MYLSKLSSSEISEKKVFLRVDLDVDANSDKTDLRLQAIVPSVKFLLNGGVSQIFLAGHMGRFKEGEESKSTETLLPVLEELVGQKVSYGKEIKEGVKIYLLPNLRSTVAEEENSEEFAKELASLADMYVNDAFAVSHRSHASIVGVAKLIPGYLGLHFEKEIEVLGKVLENPDRPVVSLISGIKEDKINYFEDFKKFSDKVLIGGRLPEYIDSDYGKTEDDKYLKDPKLMVAKLIQDREDITLHSIENFKEEIKKAKTIILAGVLGHYEEEGHRQGTYEVFKAIVESEAYKIAGGGDTETALGMFGWKEKFDFLSVGGGAMLEFLSKGTLPGIEVLK